MLINDTPPQQKSNRRGRRERAQFISGSRCCTEGRTITRTTPRTTTTTPPQYTCPDRAPCPEEDIDYGGDRIKLGSWGEELPVGDWQTCGELFVAWLLTSPFLLNYKQLIHFRTLLQRYAQLSPLDLRPQFSDMRPGKLTS